MWELDYKESWASKNWCFQTGAGEDSWESLGQQGDQICQSWRKSILNMHWKDWGWSSNTRQPDLKSRLIRKDSDAGKDWRQEEKGMIDDEMVGWHCWLNGYEFEQTPRDSEGQGSLAYCSPWGCKELDTAEQLNNNYWRWNHYLVSSPTLPIQNFLTFSGFSDFTLPFPSFNTVFYFALYFWSIESFISDPSKKNRWLIFKNSKLPGGFGEKFLGKIWGEDCRVGDFLLTGEEVAG